MRIFFSEDNRHSLRSSSQGSNAKPNKALSLLVLLTEQGIGIYWQEHGEPQSNHSEKYSPSMDDAFFIAAYIKLPSWDSEDTCN